MPRFTHVRTHHGSTYVPLHSIALPPPDAARAVQQQQQQQQQSRVPFRAAVDRQIERLVLLRHQQQLNNLQQQQQQQQEHLPLARLGAAAAGREQLPRDETAQLLQGVGLLLPELSAPQLALAAWGASMLPHGAALSACDGWQQALLAAAAQHFAAGTMCDASAAKLLQALVKLQAQPDAAWLAAACHGMPVSGWSDPRSLSTVAACLPQLGRAPSSSWARNFYAAAAGARLAAFPGTSLARMLQGVVAWQQLQQQQQQQWPDGAGRQEELPPPPEPWLSSVLQQLHARSSELRPPEVAMVLMTLSRLQQQAVAAQRQGQQSSSSSHQHAVLPSPGCQADSPLQLLGQQLLHALLPAVLQQLQFFSGHDLAAVLYALAQLQLQQDQEQQQLGKQAGPDAATCEPCCTWQWLRQVLAAAQDGLHRCDARTQVTTLFAAATLIAPHLEQQQQQRQQAQVQALQQQLGLPGLVGPPAAPPPAPRQLTHATRAPRWSVLVRPVRPTRPEQQALAWQQGAPAANSSSAETQAQETAARGVWRAWLDAFCVTSLPLLPTFSCQDLVQASCTLAGQRQAPSAAWYEQLLEAVQQQLPAMTPGQVAGVAWALARMALLPCQHNPAVSLVPLQPWMARLYSYSGLPIGGAAGQRAAAGAGSSRRPTELARLMWAAGVCDFDPGPAWWAAAEQQLAAHATAAAAASAGRQLQPVLPARLLGAVAQAYGAAGRSMPPALLQQLVVQGAVCKQLPREPVSNTLRLLRGLSRAGSALPQQWLQQLASGFQHTLAELEPAELPQLVLCLADAGLQLQDDNAGTAADAPDSSSSSWQLDCVRATQRLAPRMAARDASLMLWGAAKLRLRLPPAAIEALALRLQAGFLEAPPAALAQGIDALSRLGHTPSSDWLGAFLMATHRRYTAAAGAAAAVVQDADASMSSVGTSISGRLVLAAAIVQTLSGLARLQTPVQPRWLKHQLLLLHAQLPLLQPRHIASLLLALAKLKCRPGAAYLQHMLQQLGDCSSCSALDLVHVAYACACLRWQPSPAWMRLFLAAAAAKLPDMTPQGLALLHWALAVVRVVPPQRWRSRSVAAVAARVGQLDALQLSMVVWAWGRMRVHLTPSHAALMAAAGDSSRRSSSSSSAVACVLSPSALQRRRRRLAELLLGRAWQLRGHFSAAALAHCLAGVAKMQLTPSQDWLHGMVTCGSCETLSSLDGYCTQQLLRALARLRYRAPPAWVEQMGLLAETKWQQHDGTRHSAEWALAQLRALATLDDA
jgi:hypothetical protein